MKHSMRLYPSPFAKIKSGQKTIELRLDDEKRSIIRVGDKIEFTEVETGERLTATVINLHRFANFEELYSRLPPEKCGYAAGENAQPGDMNAYYTREQREKYGALGIEIRVDDEL